MKKTLTETNLHLRYLLRGKFISIVLLIAIVVFQAKAQTANTYQFAASSGTFTPLVGGTATSLVATADDDISTAFPIGFTFVYEGISYTQVMAMSNGPLLFGTGRTQSAANNLATATVTQRPGVVALWDDLQCSSGVTYQLSGVAPNRVLTVQWLNMEWNWSSTIALSYQVKLYETTNVISFIYRQEAGGNPAGSGGASIGIMGVASANYISLQNSSVSPTISTTASTNNISVKPATGQVYSFFPPPTSFCSGTPNGGTATLSNIPGCGTGNFNLTGSFPTVLGIAYQWQSSPDGITYTDLTNDTLVSLSKSPVTSLTYFRRNTTCVSTTFTGSSNAVIVKPVYGGNAQATVPICGDSLTLSLTNVSAGVNSFEWLSSSDNINWTSIFGAVLASQKIPSPSVNSFYRAVVTCNASFSTDSSVSVFVKAATGGTTTITASNCSDSTTLGVTGSTTGTGITFNWLISTDSINWTSMGISSATAKFPSPTATRFYRRVLTCGLSSDSSIAVRVNEPCQGFGPYSITRNTGVTYTTIQTTGTQFTWASAFTGDDDNTNKVSMPFPFVYQGAVQSAFYVSTNGWLSFDTATVTNNLGNDLNSTNPRRVIAPLWEDLVSLGNNNANKVALIRYATTGTAPNRVLTVEWAEMERFGYGSPSLNFQVKLYEGSNNIELVYGRMQPFDGSGTGAFDYSLGLTGNNPASGQKLALLLENSRNFSASAVNNALSIVPSCNTSILFTSGGVFNPSNSTPIPSNDSSSNPITLNVNALPCPDGCGTYYSTRGATASAVGPNPLSGNPDDDVWFQFVAPLSGQVSITTVGSSGFDPAFQVMTNLYDTVGLGIAGSRNISNTALENVQATGLTPSNTYFVRMFNAGAGSGSTSGAFSICINEIIPPPANDDTSGAITLTVGTSCTPVSGTTVGSTASTQAVCAGLADDDVWYRFTPTASVDTITVVGLGTFRAHVQVLNRSLTSLSCLNTTTNAGTVQTVLTGLFKDSIYYVRVYHTNAGTASGNFTICATGAQATAPIVVTGTKTNVLDITASVINNSVNNGGFPVIESGIVYSLNPTPLRLGIGVVDSINNPVVTTGTWSKNIAGLFASTTYYYRAYATNAIGITYGADSSFTTASGPIAPIVQIVAASNIQAFSATVGGNITSDGGSTVTASGVVYATTNNPILLGLGVVDSTTNPIVLTGTYSINPAGLLAGTKYYFRAYATNSVGTAYSSLDSFTTAPVISTFPYTENFDGTTTPWTTSAINAGTNAWVRGTPAKTTLSGAFSAPNAMVTFLTGNYLGTEDCVILSPQFNFASFNSDPVLRFRHKLKTDNDPDYDGGVIEISINNGAWTRVNDATGTGGNFNTTGSFSWYNNAATIGTLGANKFNGLTSAYTSSVNGWVESATRLTGAAGQTNVKVRFRFWADVFTDEGWAIDDIEVVNVVTPTIAATSATSSSTTGTTVNVSWTNGNGIGRIVVARLNSVLAVAPTNNTLYTANAAFGLGSTTGTGNFIVYSGTGTSVVVTGLANLTNYSFDVYEFNGKYMHNLFTTATTSSSSTLPVKLISFNGSAKNNDALLTWITASETNNKGFEVERSTDGRTFELVNFVKGAGNSNKNLNYTLTDANVLSKLAVIYYRLKQIDFDGKTTYSQVVRVTKNAESMNSMIVFPNPFNNEYNVSFNATKAGMVTLETINLEGKVVSTKTTAITQGANTVPVVEAANLSAGVYFVRLTVDGETQVMKLVKN